MKEAAIAAAFRAACAGELAALKPGNVHVHAEGHGMTVNDFLRSADAAAAPLCRTGAPLGTRVLQAVAATRAAVGQNTNLGILLLAAPLAMAAEQGTTVQAILDQTNLADADAVFRAIVLAAPGGLGEAAEHDVRRPASVPLGRAMAEAAGRDSIARQYVTGFADVFAARDAYAAACRCWPPPWPASVVYLRFLAAGPDSHLLRRHHPAAAASVQAVARMFADRMAGCDAPAVLTPALRAWDAVLKRQGRNPGTSADLTVAAIFAASLPPSLRSAQDNA
ncbi:MAG: triphosphoribosyl-dephospho-CoA synthase [Alphaproteobacteria bacterium]|nr:triphosphoribosyl-dephospho-CoA synthase [Alphaproteobacteria bacterium]